MACSLSTLHPKVLTSKNRNFLWSAPRFQVIVERHAFFEDLKKYWMFLKFAGMLPYHLDAKGNVLLSFISKEMVYSLFMYIATCIPVMYILHTRGVLNIFKLPNFDSMIFSLMMSSLMVPQLLIPQTHWLDMKIMQRCFGAWRDFQKCYEGVLNAPLSLKLEWKKYRCGLTAMLLVVLIFAMTFFLTEARCLWEFCAQIYVFWVVVLHDMLMVHQCLLVLCIARKLRTKLIEAVKKDQCHVVAECSVLWLQLNELKNYAGAVFFRMHIHVLLIVFGVTTICFYGIFLRMAGHNFERISQWYPLICVQMNATWIYLFCELGERVSTDMGEKFLQKLAITKQAAKTMDTKYEVDSFICLIKSVSTSFSFNGYVTINRRLLVTMYSTMATYLIVVLQFAQDYSTSSNQRSNSTILNSSCSLVL